MDNRIWFISLLNRELEVPRHLLLRTKCICFLLALVLILKGNAVADCLWHHITGELPGAAIIKLDQVPSADL